jgi:hypothetical protein
MTAFPRRWLIPVVILGVVLLAAAAAAVWFNNDRTRLSPVMAIGGLVRKWPHPPRPTHVIVIVEENKASESIIGSASAPYINELARKGAFFTQASGVAHPSQPNYLAIFAGVTNSDGDDCPEETVPASTPTLGGRLKSSGLTFGGYSEGMPTVGFTGCSVPGQPHGYARKHNPWVNFDDVTPTENLPLKLLPSAYNKLPTVAFIVPTLAHDMHDGTIAAGDAWLHDNVGPIVDWAQTHGALVIVTWDESDEQRSNHIPMIFIGQDVKPGRYYEATNHYNVLRTIEDFYGLAPLGKSLLAAPIEDCWLAGHH